MTFPTVIAGSDGAYPVVILDAPGEPIQVLACQRGPAGPGVPAGGVTGQVLTKSEDGNFKTAWRTYSTAYWGGFNTLQDIPDENPFTGEPAAIGDRAFIAATGALVHWDGAMWRQPTEGVGLLGMIAQARLADISADFDGTTVDFALTLEQGGTAINATSAQQLTIVLDGVPQEPGVEYTLFAQGDGIRFASPPPPGTDFWGLIAALTVESGIALLPPIAGVQVTPLQDISAGFDGTATQFALSTAQGGQVSLSGPAQVFVSLDGVPQAPGEEYVLHSSNTIEFDTPPRPGARFWAVWFQTTDQLGEAPGTVTSVAVTGTDGIEVDSGSPITTTGVITLGLNAAAVTAHLGLGNTVQSVVAGTNVTVDNTDPRNPVISASGGSGGTTDHGALTNRDAADSHPMTAVTGLTAALAGKEPVIPVKNAAFNVDFGSAAGTACEGNDARLSDSRPPTGAASGVLAGTFPAPTFAVDMATQAELDAHTGNTSNPHGTTAVQVGADPAGTAASAVSAHASAADPHPGYALEADLATVATSGAYADLSGTPTIPSTPGDIGAAAEGSQFTVAADQHVYGFIPGDVFNLSYDAATNTFTLTPPAADWSYYRAGVKRQASGAKTVQLLPLSDGYWYVYLAGNDGALTATQTPWTLDPSFTGAFVAALEIRQSNTPSYLLYDELHLADLTRGEHAYLHHTAGSKFRSGATISGYTLDDGANDSSLQFDLAAGVFNDETLLIDVPAHVGGTDDYLIRWRDGAGGFDWAESSVPFALGSVGAYIGIDAGTGALTDAAANRWCNVYVLMTAAGRYQVVQPQAAHTSASEAEAEQFTDLTLTGLPVAEYVAKWKVTYRTRASNTTTGRVELTRVEAINVATIPGVSALDVRPRDLPVGVFKLQAEAAGVSHAYAHLEALRLEAVSDPWGLLQGGDGTNTLTLPAGWGGTWEVSGMLLVNTLGGATRLGILTTCNGIQFSSFGNAVSNANFPVYWAGRADALDAMTFQAQSNAAATGAKYWTTGTVFTVRWLGP